MMSEESSVTTSSTTYITADGRKVRKVKKKKVTIEEGSLNGSRRESEVEISEISSTLNSETNQNNDPNTRAIAEKQRSDSKELVLDESRTQAMDSDWHEKHFSCWQCDENLTAKKYVLRDDKSYCIKCFESNFSSTCDSCKKIIGIDSKDLCYKEKHWHEVCFLCTQCSISLVDKNFGSKSDKLYCSDCYDQQFSTKCEACGDVFRSGSKKVEYKGQVFHDHCFVCAGCKTPIGSKRFVPKDSETYCTDCYEAKFAHRCCKCKNTITGNGLFFRNDNWHKECFTCTHCNTQLFGTKFTTKEDKPYCTDCFGNLFARKCTRCTKGIISGGSGSRFISFEDRHWHNDCFVCSGCSTSLTGKGFIPDGPDILCSECARQRLT